MSKKRPSAGDDGTNTRLAKKSRQFTDQRLESARIFSDLADDAENIRLEAALALVQKCKNNSGIGKEPVFENARLTYGRLIRGLCSNRKSARHGFFVALVEVLRLFKSSTELKDGCLKDITGYTTPSDSDVGQERRDHLIGRMSAYTAVVHSKLFFHGSNNQMDRFRSLLNAILDDYNKFPWLHEQVGSVLLQTLDVLEYDRAPEDWFTAIVEVLLQRNLAKTPLGVAFWLRVRSLAPSVRLPKHVWHHQNPLSSQELSNVVYIMKCSTGADIHGDQAHDLKVSTGARQRIPSFTWSVIVDNFAKENHVSGQETHSSAKWRRQFAQFWNDAVDETFFALFSSHERRQIGLQILLNEVPRRPAWMLETMLSSNLVQCLISQCAQSGRYLNSMAKSVLDVLIAKARDDLKACTAILNRLLLGPDASRFDQRTKSSTVGTIFDMALRISSSDVNIFRHLEQHYEHFSATVEKHDHAQCQTVANLVADYARKHAHDSYSDCPQAVSALIFLAQRAYWYDKVSLDTDGDSHKGMARVFRQAFEASMSAVALKRNRSVLNEIVRRMASHILSNSRQSTEDIRSPLSWLHDEFSISSRSLVFELLFGLSVLMLADKDTDALTNFYEVKAIHSQSLSGLTDTDANIMTDMVLQFISRPSAMYRRIATWTFENLSSHIGSEGLQTLLDVLEKEENISGKDDLEQEAVEDASDDGELHDSDGENATGNVHNIEIGSDGEEQAADDGASSASATSSPTQSESSELTRFNSALASALRTTDTANGAGGSDSSSDASMDSEQMLAVEPQLAEMFRQRLGEGTSETRKSAKPGGEKKQEQAAARRDILDFKNRVLDMLETWLQGNPGDQLALQAIVPLLRLARTTRAKQIREKTGKILKGWQATAKKKGEPPFAAKVSEEDGDTSWDVLNAIHEEALGNPFTHLHVSLCSSSSLFVCRCAVRGAKGRKDEERVMNKRLQRIGKLYEMTHQKAGSQLKATGFWKDFETWKREVSANLERSQ